MPSIAPTKKLLVEGNEELRLIPYFIEGRGIPWGDTKKDHIVTIEQREGYSNIVAEGAISVEFKASNLRILGIIVDADSDCKDRWTEVRDQCIDSFPTTPDTLPGEGLIISNNKNQKLGVWIMPDNFSSGMLETFLAYLVDGSNDTLWKHAESSTASAKSHGATYRNAHIDKARIHTYLSWADPPGKHLFESIKEKILDPHGKYGDQFFDWFKKLYEL